MRRLCCKPEAQNQLSATRCDIIRKSGHTRVAKLKVIIIKDSETGGERIEAQERNDCHNKRVSQKPELKSEQTQDVETGTIEGTLLNSKTD